MNINDKIYQENEKTMNAFKEIIFEVIEKNNCKANIVTLTNYNNNELYVCVNFKNEDANTIALSISYLTYTHEINIMAHYVECVKVYNQPDYVGSLSSLISYYRSKKKLKIKIKKSLEKTVISEENLK